MKSVSLNTYDHFLKVANTVMKDDITTSLHQVKGELTFDDVYLGELIINRIFVTNHNFIVIEFDLIDISKEFFSVNTHSISFQSDLFNIECHDIHYTFEDGRVSIVLHRNVNPSLRITYTGGKKEEVFQVKELTQLVQRTVCLKN